MLAKGSQLNQWGSRVRMKRWGQAMVATDSAIKEDPEGHRLGGDAGEGVGLL